MNIKIKTTIEGLRGINQALSGIIFQHGTLALEVRVLQSVGEDIAEKVFAKIKKAVKDESLFTTGKEYAVDLKLHEAYGLHGILKLVMSRIDLNDLEKVKLQQVLDTLDQKLI